jgi:hypothetical protein
LWVIYGLLNRKAAIYAGNIIGLVMDLLMVNGILTHGKKLSADSQKQILDLLCAVVEQMHMQARNPSTINSRSKTSDDLSRAGG